MTAERETSRMSLEDELVRRYNLRVIKPQERYELPPELEFGALEDMGIDEKFARDFLGRIAKFRNFSMIIDTFDTAHHERRSWRDEVYRDYGKQGLDLVYENKLRVNRFSFVGAFFARVHLGRIRKNSSSVLWDNVHASIDDMEQRYRSAIEGYGEMSLDQKIAAVKVIEGICDEIVDLFRISR